MPAGGSFSEAGLAPLVPLLALAIAPSSLARQRLSLSVIPSVNEESLGIFSALVAPP